jgi:RimJ/RimL family protein N-acetyltransferase
LLIHPDNARSRALAERTRFERQADLDGHPYYKRPVPPLAYEDRGVTMRRPHGDDLPMGPAGVRGAFGTGPRWTFALDLLDERSVGRIDVDLLSDHAPPGEASISYRVHPAFRRRPIASTAIELALRFLRDHTGTRRAVLVVDPREVALRGVARSVGATVGAVTSDRHGHSLVRHWLEL